MAGQGKTTQIGEVSRWGGWRGSPNSIAALLRCQVRYADQRHCKRCGQTASRGSDYCRFHGGHPARGRSITGAGGRAESRLLQRLERIGLLPPDLLAHPAWSGLTGLARAKRAPLRLALLRAWDKRDQAPLYWAQTQRQALDAGRQANPAWGVLRWHDHA